MKKVFLAALIAASAIGAQTYAGVNNFEQAEMQAPAKEKIEIDKLPETVKKTLASDAFKGAEAVEAYVVKDATTYYEITLKKDGKNAVVKIAEDGSVLS